MVISIADFTKPSFVQGIVTDSLPMMTLFAPAPVLPVAPVIDLDSVNIFVNVMPLQEKVSVMDTLS